MLDQRSAGFQREPLNTSELWEKPPRAPHPSLSHRRRRALQWLAHFHGNTLRCAQRRCALASSGKKRLSVSEKSPSCGGSGRQCPRGTNHVGVTVPSGGGCLFLHRAIPRFSDLPHGRPRRLGAGNGTGEREAQWERVKQPTSRNVTGMICMSRAGSCVSYWALATNRQGNRLYKALVASSPDLPKVAKCPAARKNQHCQVAEHT